jgi:hypothetical protein
MNVGVPVEVTVRCEPCARDLGRSAPALVSCVRPGNGRWTIIGLFRGGRRQRDIKVDFSKDPRFRGTRDALQRRLGADYPGAPDRTASRIDAIRHRKGSGVELTCRRCSHRPRVSRRRLYELAEQALAAGRRDAYV